MPKVKSTPEFKKAEKVAEAGNPSRAWCVTWNNPGEVNILKARAGTLICPSQVRYAIFQLELGELETPHFQMYLEFEKPVRFSAIKKLLDQKVHCEPRKSTREKARDYCQKEDTRSEGPWEVGTWTGGGQGARSDLLSLLTLAKAGASALNAWEAAPEAMARYGRAFNDCRLAYAMGKQREGVQVHVFYGESGTGKTHDVEEKIKEHLDKGENVYRKPPGQWWDGYSMEPVVVFDEFYGSSLSYSEFLRCLDKYPMTVQIKGGTVPLHALTFYITSNAAPADWYPNIVDKLPVVRRLTSITQYTRTPHGVLKADRTSSLRKEAGSPCLPAPFSPDSVAPLG